MHAAAVGEAGGATGALSGTATFFYLMVGAGLILHIVTLVQSRKVGISITGHILGIIGCGCFILTMLLALPAFILLILAAIFSIMQKPAAK